MKQKVRMKVFSSMWLVYLALTCNAVVSAISSFKVGYTRGYDSFSCSTVADFLVDIIHKPHMAVVAGRTNSIPFAIGQKGSFVSSSLDGHCWPHSVPFFSVICF